MSFIKLFLSIILVFPILLSAQVDTDNDGMPDDWEFANGLDINDPVDAFCDPDGDQVINLFEFQLQTDLYNDTEPRRIEITPQITQADFQAIYEQGFTEPICIRMQTGEYAIQYNLSAVNTNSYRVMLQGGWNTDFSVYDPFSTPSVVGPVLGGIVNINSTPAANYGCVVLDGITHTDDRSFRGNRFTHRGNESHFSLYNCVFHDMENRTYFTFIDNQNAHVEILNCSFVNVGFFDINNLTFPISLVADESNVDGRILNTTIHNMDWEGNWQGVNVTSFGNGSITMDIINSNVWSEGTNPYTAVGVETSVTLVDINLTNSNLSPLGNFGNPNIRVTEKDVGNQNPDFLNNDSTCPLVAVTSPLSTAGIDMGVAYTASAPDIGFNKAIKVNQSDFEVIVTQPTCDRADGKLEINYTGYIDPLIFVAFYAQYSIDGENFQDGLFEELSGGTYELWATSYLDDCVHYLGEFVLENLADIDFDLQETKASCGEANGVITVIPPGDISDYEYAIVDTTDFQSSNVFTDLPADVYVLYFRPVSDRDCVIRDVLILNQDSDIALMAVDATSTTCGKSNGAVTLDVNGAMGNPVFFNENSAQQSLPEFTDLSAGNYTFYVEDDEGCQDSISLIIVGSEGIAVTDTTVTQPTCGLDNGAIALQLNAPSSLSEILLNGQSTTLLENADLESGNYNIIVTDTIGCVEELEVILEPSVPVEIISIDPQATKCALANGALNVTEVSGNPTAYSTDGITYEPVENITGLAAGDYLLYAQNDICADTASFNIGISTQPEIVLSSFSGTDCGEENGSAALDVISGTGPYDFDLDTLTNTDGIFETLPAGEYVAYVQDFADCQDSTDLSIANSVAVVLTAAVQEGLCGELGSIVLGASFGDNNIFSDEDGNNQNSAAYTQLEGGEYIFYVRTEEDCLDTLMLEVPVFTIPELEITDQSPAYCEDPIGSITVSGTGGKGELSYALEGQQLSSLREYNELAEGTYLMTVSDETGCTSTKEIVIEATPRVRIEDLSAEQLFCGDFLSAVQFTPAGGTGALTYRLTDSSGDEVNEEDGLAEGQYRLTVVDELGCEKVEFVIVNKQDCQIYIPTAFNPNSDSENRAFMLGVPSASSFVIEYLSVYDRWGNLVYNEEGIDPLTFTRWWDGTYKGSEVEQGVYLYRLQMGGQDKESISGNVTVIR